MTDKKNSICSLNKSLAVCFSLCFGFITVTLTVKPKLAMLQGTVSPFSSVVVLHFIT